MLYHKYKYKLRQSWLLATVMQISAIFALSPVQTSLLKLREQHQLFSERVILCLKRQKVKGETETLVLVLLHPYETRLRPDFQRNCPCLSIFVATNNIVIVRFAKMIKPVAALTLLRGMV